MFKLTDLYCSAALMSARRDGIKSEPGNSEDELENWDDEPDKVKVLSIVFCIIELTHLP